MHVLRHPRFTPFPYTTLFRSIQFPIARAYANVRAADLMSYEAARLFDEGRPAGAEANLAKLLAADASDRKSTRLNSSHLVISYAVFCLKKKSQENERKHIHHY